MPDFGKRPRSCALRVCPRRRSRSSTDRSGKRSRRLRDLNHVPRRRGAPASRTPDAGNSPRHRRRQSRSIRNRVQASRFAAAVGAEQRHRFGLRPAQTPRRAESRGPKATRRPATRSNGSDRLIALSTAGLRGSRRAALPAILTPPLNTAITPRGGHDEIDGVLDQQRTAIPISPARRRTEADQAGRARGYAASPTAGSSSSSGGFGCDGVPRDLDRALSLAAQTSFPPAGRQDAIRRYPATRAHGSQLLPPAVSRRAGAEQEPPAKPASMRAQSGKHAFESAVSSRNSPPF